MTGLDTYILVRYILRDEPVQSAKAERLVEQFTESDPGFISAIAVVEIAWVLESVYEFRRNEIAAAIQRMLQIDVLIVEHRFEIYLAIAAFKQRRGDFADALIGAINARAGCGRTVTFDRKAARLPHFQLL
ncbi:MAG TPA: type II toxin-antitoxin system VapC family toxin [Candidatus Binatia bacterium]|nr:type II toxin-antitoxin system VapC family toxin [Candidatus Binatia bacterium]